MSAYHHQTAIPAHRPVMPLSVLRSAKGGWKRSAMGMTCVGQACTATRDASLARSIFAGRDDKREVDSTTEDDGT